MNVEKEIHMFSHTIDEKLSTDLTWLPVIPAIAGIGTAIYGVVFGLRNYKQKIKQDKMQTLLELIKDFQSESLTYAKKILDLRVIRPEKSWKNSVHIYDMEWQKILQGDCRQLNCYLKDKLGLSWIKEKQEFETKGNSIVTHGQEVGDHQEHTLVITPDEDTELLMNPLEDSEHKHYLVANIVDGKVSLLFYYYHISYLENILRPLQESPIKDMGVDKIWESFDRLLDFFAELEYLLRLKLIDQQDITYFDYYIHEAAKYDSIQQHIKKYEFALEGKLNENLCNDEFKEKLKSTH